jgi:hypothetical protein
LGNYATKRGARTITINADTGTLYLPTADFDPTKTNANGRPMMVRELSGLGSAKGH